MNFSQYYLEQKSSFEVLKSNKINLTDEERKEVMAAKAVWHPGNRDQPISAIWKSKDSSGKVWFGCNTHRAWAKAATLKGAIAKFHDFIKGTS